MVLGDPAGYSTDKEMFPVVHGLVEGAGEVPHGVPMKSHKVGVAPPVSTHNYLVLIKIGSSRQGH